VGRYVIMPDHVHLFVSGGNDFSLGPWVGLLKQALAKAARLSRARRQIWEEGFFDHVLRATRATPRNGITSAKIRSGLD
jgi:REP element-mobilizing transposase RayT